MPPMAHLPRDGFGPHGDRYLPWSIGLNLKRLMASEHGIDLGPLESGVSRRVLHRDRRVRLAAEPILSALTELETNWQATAAWCSSVDAICAAVTAGCTTSRLSSQAASAAWFWLAGAKPNPFKPKTARGAYVLGPLLA